MKKFILVLILAQLLFLETFAQVPFFGGCPSTTAVKSFDVSRYLGKWFEIRSYPAAFTIGSSCTQAEYSLFPNSSIRVKNRALQFGKVINIVGNAAQAKPGFGELVVNFPSTGQPSTQTPNYIIIGTDYKRFAVVHSCTPFYFINFQFAWVLSRTRTLTGRDESKISKILKDNGVSQTFFLGNTRQTNCPKL